MDLTKLMSTLRKKYSKTVLDFDSALTEMECFPTGHFLIDRVLGGGIPRGKIIELWGLEGTGKSSLALQIALQVQKKDMGVLYVDYEHGFSREYARSLGLDETRLIVVQPDWGEQGFDMMREAIEDEGLGLIILDSIAAVVPKKQIDGEMGEHQIGLQSIIISNLLKQLTGKLSKAKVSLIAINQVRNKINTYGGGEDTPGGKALKFYAWGRVKMTKVGGIKQELEEGGVKTKLSGQKVRVETVKNKGCCPFKETTLDFIFGKGFDEVTSVVEAAMANKLIVKNGSYFAYNGTSYRGLEAIKEAVRNSASYEELKNVAGVEDKKLPDSEESGPEVGEVCSN